MHDETEVFVPVQTGRTGGATFGETNAVSLTDAGSVAAMARERFEIEGAMVLARKFPRSEVGARSALKAACERPTFAEGALWSFPRGDEIVTGPSVHLAREAARLWGNIRSGFRIVSTDQAHAEIHILGFAIDLESNTYRTEESRVRARVWRRRLRSTGEPGSVNLLDERAAGRELGGDADRQLQEVVGRTGSKLERNCVLRILPSDLIDNAEDWSRATMLNRPDPDRVRAALAYFAEHGAEETDVLAFFGRDRIADMTNANMAELRRLFLAVRDGQTDVRNLFARPEPAVVPGPAKDPKPAPKPATKPVSVDPVVEEEREVGEIVEPKPAKASPKPAEPEPEPELEEPALQAKDAVGGEIVDGDPFGLGAAQTEARDAAPVNLNELREEIVSRLLPLGVPEWLADIGAAVAGNMATIHENARRRPTKAKVGDLWVRGSDSNLFILLAKGSGGVEWRGVDELPEAREAFEAKKEAWADGLRKHEAAAEEVLEEAQKVHDEVADEPEERDEPENLLADEEELEEGAPPAPARRHADPDPTWIGVGDEWPDQVDGTRPVFLNAKKVAVYGLDSTGTWTRATSVVTAKDIAHAKAAVLGEILAGARRKGRSAGAILADAQSLANEKVNDLSRAPLSVLCRLWTDNR